MPFLNQAVLDASPQIHPLIPAGTGSFAVDAVRRLCRVQRVTRDEALMRVYVILQERARQKNARVLLYLPVTLGEPALCCGST